MPSLFSSRREKEKQEYYDNHASLVYGTILRYQTQVDVAAVLLEKVFTDVLSLKLFKQISKEKLCTIAVQRSLLEVLQPVDTVITYDDRDEHVYTALQEADVNSLGNDELQEIFISLPLHERVFYHALVTDGIPKKDIAIWTGFPKETIGKIVANAKFLIAKSVAEKVASKS